MVLVSVCHQGCDPLSQTQRSKLQHRRARINQQINKEMRMRAGAENLFRATSNNKVRETVALELSFVNSNLQLLKEELEELNSNMEVYQTDSEAVNVPMIPLGLKETKDVDFSLPIQDFILEHYGEEASLYDGEIKELTELRQAMRTPSRTQEGLELLMEYYNQLFYLDQRFFPPNRNLGVHFHWYDSLTGVPSCQRALAFEKGSVLFNLGSLHTQMGARQDRSCTAGVDRAIDAFQRAAGAFNYLKDNFSNAPSLDMSGPSLSMLVRLMVAQGQECVFERVTLATWDATFTSLLRLAQEASQVSEVYSLALQTMSQPLVKDYVPFSWLSHRAGEGGALSALSHYYAAAALCDHSRESPPPFHPPTPITVLRDPEQRRKLGKAHLRRAVMRHEEAMRVHGLCRILRKMDILQDVLSLTHRRALDKYSELDCEDDFDETSEGPLSVFSARARWSPRAPGLSPERRRGARPHAQRGLPPSSGRGPAGLREGDYLVGVEGQDCKWSKHADVVQLLKACGHRAVCISVVTLHPAQHTQVWETVYVSMALSQGDKENTRQRLLIGGNKGQSSASLLNWNRKKKREGGGASRRLGSTFSLSLGSIRDTESMY
uniref:Rhophilin Rho GTPase binding protein 1 n=1 Tax=Gadus morhua TaxID=8049 RepID=A0A8C4YXS4_GADMO